MAVDILKSGLSLKGSTACIIAPGPYGAKAYHLIDPRWFTTVVNKAVMFGQFRKDVWAAEDLGLRRTDWFEGKVETMLRDPGPTKVVFGLGKMTSAYPSVPYYYKSGGSLGDSRTGYNLIPGKMASGATIASKAVQLNVQLGAQTIILCGVDMKGKTYADGTPTLNKQEYPNLPRWKAATRFENLIIQLQSQGIEIYTISETALNGVPMWED